MKALITALLTAATLAGCVAVPVYEPAPRAYAYPAPGYGYYRYHHHHRY